MMLSFFAAVFAIGMFLQPQKIDIEKIFSKAHTYDAKGALLKIVADIESRRIKINENEVKIYHLDGQYVLIQRQQNVPADDDLTAAIYLVEVANEQRSGTSPQLYVQTTLVDLFPGETQGALKIGNFRYF